MEIECVPVTAGMNKSLQDRRTQVETSPVDGTPACSNLLCFSQDAFNVDRSAPTCPLPSFAAARRHPRLVKAVFALDAFALLVERIVLVSRLPETPPVRPQVMPQLVVYRFLSDLRHLTTPAPLARLAPQTSKP